MKNNYLFIATLLVVATVSVAVVSCKKETASALTDNKNESVQTFNPREIEDMNAYLKDFKQKMNSTSKGEDESLTLEDAAWHLSSLANYDFGHANVEYNDVRFDTLYAQVNVSDGEILLSDLASTYEEIHMGIDKFYHSLTLDNKHFRFIGASIAENGQVLISLMTTFSNGSKDLGDHCWYYQNEYDALLNCYSYFNLVSYPFSTTGTMELQRVLNLVISHLPLDHGIYYFTPLTSTFFYYRDYIDPYGSPCYKNSRIFASCTVDDDLVDIMCYLLDSYLGLGCDNCPTGESILRWTVSPCIYEPPFQGEHLSKQYHELTVEYGIKQWHDPIPGDNDY